LWNLWFYSMEQLPDNQIAVSGLNWGAHAAPRKTGRES
jgi:hypothetical protein